MLRHRRLGFVLAFLALLLPVAPPRAQGSDPAEQPVRFDYFLLSLSLAPSFCALSSHNRSTPECKSLTQADFQQTPLTVHGLWPNRIGASVNRQPQDCAGPRFDVSPAVQTQLQRYMPGGTNLEKHEWQKHGTCSGLTPQVYFATIVRLAQQANETIGAAMRSTGAFGHTLHIADLLSAVAAKDQTLASAIIVDCRTPKGGGPTVIEEIRVVLSKDFAPMSAKSVLLGQNSGCPRGAGQVPDVSGR